MILKTYDLTPDIANLMAELGADRVEVLLKLSSQEEELSRRPSSLMILGRSGTGKTTGEKESRR